MVCCSVALSDRMPNSQGRPKDPQAKALANATSDVITTSSETYHLTAT